VVESVENLLGTKLIFDISVYPAKGQPGSRSTKLDSGAEKRLRRSPIEGFGPRPQASARLTRAAVVPQAIAQSSVRRQWGLSQRGQFCTVFPKFYTLSVEIFRMFFPVHVCLSPLWTVKSFMDIGPHVFEKSGTQTDRRGSFIYIHCCYFGGGLVVEFVQNLLGIFSPFTNQNLFPYLDTFFVSCSCCIVSSDVRVCGQFMSTRLPTVLYFILFLDTDVFCEDTFSTGWCRKLWATVNQQGANVLMLPNAVRFSQFRHVRFVGKFEVKSLLPHLAACRYTTLWNIWHFLGRLFHRSDLIKPLSNVRPSVHKSFFDFIEIFGM